MADIFDRMLDGINKGVNSIATGSKTMVEKSRINGIISGLERDKNSIIGQIGYKVYEIYKAGELKGYDEIEQLCAAIDAKDEEIDARRKELDMLNAPPAPQYQQQPYQVDDQYRVERPYQPEPQPEQNNAEPQSAAPAAFCPNCGRPNGSGAAFCAYCGARIM